MKKYLTLFNSHAEYEQYVSGNFEKPNVSHCVQEDDVHYNPLHDYSKDYLTFVALEDGTISFNILDSMGTDMITSISYSTDNGETWTTTANQNNKQENLSIDVDVNEGDKVMWKGIATQTGYYFNDDDFGYYVGSFFSSDCEFDAKGNVMSLLYGDDFKGETTIEEDATFCRLFSDTDEGKTCGVVNAKELSLPATTLANNCYENMFYYCTSLTSAPELPATTLASSCYFGMFYGCTGLTTAPELPATTLVFGCYRSMFEGCTSLTTAPVLPATTLADYCYAYMFNGCTSLVTAPELSATTLAYHCYQGMFANCSRLTTAPELPATTLVGYCYSNMFRGCVGLITAPQLPATTLASWCYESMFQGCKSLTTAPQLPATTLTTYCYQNMFNGCTKLNYIKAMFTTTPSTSYTSGWVSGVAATGTFVKNSAATWNVTGVNGVPSRWTVQTASA